MKVRRPAQKASQPDLFGRREPNDGPVGRPVPFASFEKMEDQEVVARIPDADMAEVDALCDQVLDRGLGDDAVPALEALWKRFFGFGVDGPTREQRCALMTLARTGSSLSRQALARIVDAPDLIDSHLPLALQCASDANLALPGQRVARWLEDGRPEVRKCAFALARNCRPRVPGHLLEAGLADPDALVRRACLVTMGHSGDARAKEGLLEELGRSPAAEVVAALACMLDDDIVTCLGRCGLEHACLREQVVEELEGEADPRARRLVERLRSLR